MKPRRVKPAVPSTRHGGARVTPADAKAVATECTCFNLRRITRRVSQHFDDVLSPSGLRCTQFSLLGMLHAPVPLTVTALANRMDLDRTSLTRNLDVLGEQGLVMVVDGPDARSRTVVLTPKGRDAFARALPLWRRGQAEVRERLGEPGVARLHDALRSSLQRFAAGES
jgi:DNA-binding MarR family transcriptional regulator